MSLEIGDRVPDASFKQLTSEGMRDITTADLCSGKKVVLFGVPGAFTPTCSDVHLPGFLDRLSEIEAKGVDTVACLSVNDAFVLNAWAHARDIPERIRLLADGNGEFVEKAGLVLDASRFGMGRRSKRFAAVIDDGVVRYLGVEPAGEVGVSSADAVLEAL